MAENIVLEGTPPKRSEGDHTQARIFLICFKRFILMNKEATIIKDTIKCCAYFLSLVEGLNAEGWSKCAYE